MPQSATKPAIFIATPCFGGLVSQHYMLSVLALIQYGSQASFDAIVALLGHDSLITRSRNTLVTQFLNTPAATHLMFIDADISFEPQHVQRMLAFDKDVVSGIYPLKVIDWDNAALKRITTGETFQTAPLLYVGTLCVGEELEREGSFATGLYCGGGFLLIKRQAIERMIAAYPESRYKRVHAYSNAKGEDNYSLFECMIDPETKTYISEDFGFCQKWRDIGGKIWLDTEGKLTHIGTYNFAGNPQPRYQPADRVVSLVRTAEG
ncbi:MAG: hypothetical protein ACLQIQ_17470 [Beijerinckiaceae bacterium]